MFAPTAAVVASNKAARTAYALYPGGSVRSITIGPEDQQALLDAIARVAPRSAGRHEVLRCGGQDGRRDFHVHLRPPEGGRASRLVLMVSSELPWNNAVSTVLEQAFGLTEAEVGVVRRLLACDTVGEIAIETGRRESTIRSQLHAILTKTATESQTEMLRLASMLQASLTLEPRRRLAPLALHPRKKVVVGFHGATVA